MTLIELANKYDIAYQTLQARAKKLGIKSKKGVKHNLTEEQIIQLTISPKFHENKRNDS